jgi:periplasmic divalent cation tolerance protein
MPSDGLTLIYSTFPDAASAEAIGGELVASKLAACVNILPGMTAIYAWQGKVERGQEVAVLLKTTSAASERLMAALRARHPYATPAIIAIDAAQVDADYLAWLRREVAPV